MLERPPLPRGTEREQLAALRDYLVRLAGSLEQLSAPAALPAQTAAGNKPIAASREELQRAAGLRALIVKTGEVLRHELDVLTEELREEYLALSDFGAYQESIVNVVETTARGVVESYGYAAALRALDEKQEETARWLTGLQGQIRRGLITDPETGERCLGIAIAEQMSFTGQETSEGGLVYYELSPGQTLGLYTSTGWQFWINGSKRGWFDASDGMLHVMNLAAEQSLRLGALWELTSAGGFGIRYTG